MLAKRAIRVLRISIQADCLRSRLVQDMKSHTNEKVFCSHSFNSFNRSESLTNNKNSRNLDKEIHGGANNVVSALRLKQGKPVERRGRKVPGLKEQFVSMTAGPPANWFGPGLNLRARASLDVTRSLNRPRISRRVSIPIRRDVK